MYGKDYKNALNELKLSSAFCEEMEKKLALDSSDEDYYEETVSHVEVVKKRSIKKFAAAAAAVAVIGTAGGGALLNISDKVKEDPFTVSDISDIETPTETDSTNTVYEFPFGKLDFGKFVFGYSRAYTTLSVVPSTNIAPELCRLFETFDITKVDNAPDPVELSEKDSISFDMYSYLVTFGINMLKVFDNDYLVISRTAVFDNNGNQIYISKDGSTSVFSLLTEGPYVSDTDDGQSPADESEGRYFENVYEYYYLGKGAFNKIRRMLYGDDKFTNVDFLRVSGDLISATFEMKDRDGIFTPAEAYDVAGILNSTEWKGISLPNGIPEDEESFTIFIDGENKQYSVQMTEKGNAFISVTESKTGGKDSENALMGRTYSFDPEVYSRLRKILAGAEKLTEDCPLGDDIWDYDTALVKPGNSNGINKPFRIKGDGLKELITTLKDMTWQNFRTEKRYSQVFTGTPYTIYVGPYTITYHAGMIYVINSSGEFTFNNYTLEKETAAILNRIMTGAEKISIPDRELVEIVINSGLKDFTYVDYVNYISVSSNTSDHDKYLDEAGTLEAAINSYLTNSIAHLQPKANDTELKEALLSLDWEITEAIVKNYGDTVYQIGSIELSEDGYLLAYEFGLYFKCSNPAKYLAVLDRMFMERSNQYDKYADMRGEGLTTPAP